MAEDESQERKLPPNARRDSNIFMMLFALTILLYLLSLPFIFGILLTGPATVFFGIRAIYRSRKVPRMALYRYAIGAGSAAALFAFFTAGAMVMFHGPVSELQNCVSRAITQSAQAQCQRDYIDNVNDVVESTFERFGVTAN